MKEIKLTKNFGLSEFVPRRIFRQYGKNSLWFIDFKIVDVAQFMRNRYGKQVVINNYLYGGQYNESGYRTPYTPTGARYSQHKFGRALDIKVTDMLPHEIREDIQHNFAKFRKKGVTTIESNTPTWTHIDTRNTNQSNLLIVPFR